MLQKALSGKLSYDIDNNRQINRRLYTNYMHALDLGSIYLYEMN